MTESFHGLFGGMGLAVVLVFLLMVIQFQSWLDPLIVLMAVPFALAGVIWMLFLTQTPISVPALMGSLMCIGLTTANSILVVTFANQRMEAGDDPRTAAIAAGYTRLRPVLMTAGAMILGMIPMALGVGEGGEQNAPLARAVIGGLLFATFATLVFVPTMYRLLRRPRISIRGGDHSCITPIPTQINRFTRGTTALHTANPRAGAVLGQPQVATDVAPRTGMKLTVFAMHFRHRADRRVRHRRVMTFQCGKRLLQRRRAPTAHAPPAVDVVSVQNAPPTQHWCCPAKPAPGTRRRSMRESTAMSANWFSDIGDTVKKGQVLATIDTPELDDQLAAARAKLKAAQAEVTRAAIQRRLCQDHLPALVEFAQGGCLRSGTGREKGGIRQRRRPRSGRRVAGQSRSGRNGQPDRVDPVQAGDRAIRRHRYARGGSISGDWSPPAAPPARPRFTPSPSPTKSACLSMCPSPPAFR